MPVQSDRTSGPIVEQRTQQKKKKLKEKTGERDTKKEREREKGYQAAKKLRTTTRGRWRPDRNWPMALGRRSDDAVVDHRTIKSGETRARLRRPNRLHPGGGGGRLGKDLFGVVPAARRRGQDVQWVSAAPGPGEGSG